MQEPDCSSIIQLQVLPVLHGDALHLSYWGDDYKCHHIFVDSGCVATYRRVIKRELEKIKNSQEKVDLFVITHTDLDHIGGVLKLVEDPELIKLVEQFWFNYSTINYPIHSTNGEISIINGIVLRDFLLQNGQIHCTEISSELPEVNLHGAKIKVFSPSIKILENFKLLWNSQEEVDDGFLISQEKNDYLCGIEELSIKPFQEDQKLENAVSISFLFEYLGKKILFLADSQPSIIMETLIKLGYNTESKMKIDLVKLSHHGSKHNTNNELIEMFDCDRFILSANGKNRYFFPHKEALSRILGHPNRDRSKEIYFYFNYNNEIIQSIFSSKEKSTYNFSCIFPTGDRNDLCIQL